MKTIPVIFLFTLSKANFAFSKLSNFVLFCSTTNNVKSANLLNIKDEMNKKLVKMIENYKALCRGIAGLEDK